MSARLAVLYEPRDEAMCQELIRHLGGSWDAYSLRVWSLRDIVPGEERRGAVESQIEKADIVLVLVSADFMYWEEKQAYIEQALDRARSGRLRLIPVMLRPCSLGDSPLARLQMLPRDGRPVTTWDNRDEAWVQIAEALRKIPDSPNGESSSSARSRKISEAESSVLELETHLARRRALVASHNDPGALDARIRDLKRTLREGGQLHSGDSLDVDRYFLLRQLGYGGFATVWEAEDRKRGRRVAVKVLHPQLSGKAEFRGRFVRGARVMDSIDHPAVVKILQPPLEEVGFIYFVMELMAGGDLHRAVLQGRLSRSDITPLVLRVGEAIGIAHAKKHIHRDVSPHNILLDEAGHAKLTDFDLVAASGTRNDTRSGTVLGKLIYAPIEVQENPHEADERADVFGLGMTAIFCHHGQELPRTILSDRERILKMIEPPALAGVLRIATEPDRTRRFRTIQAFCDALRDASEKGLPPAVPAPRVETFPSLVVPPVPELELPDARTRDPLPSSPAAIVLPPDPFTPKADITAPPMSTSSPPSTSIAPPLPVLPPTDTAGVMSIRGGGVVAPASVPRAESKRDAGANARIYLQVAGPVSLLLGIVGMSTGMMPVAWKVFEHTSLFSVGAMTVALVFAVFLAGRYLRWMHAPRATLAQGVFAIAALFTGLALALLVVEGRAYVQTLLSGDAWRLALARREAHHAVLDTGMLWVGGLIVGYIVFWGALLSSRPEQA